MMVLAQNIECNITNTAEPIYLYHKTKGVGCFLSKQPGLLAGLWLRQFIASPPSRGGVLSKLTSTRTA